MCAYFEVSRIDRKTSPPGSNPGGASNFSWVHSVLDDATKTGRPELVLVCVVRTTRGRRTTRIGLSNQHVLARTTGNNQPEEVVVLGP